MTDQPERAPAPTPPVAPERPEAASHPVSGRPDPYQWLCDRGSPDVQAYIAAENDYADAVMAPLRPLVETLYAETLGRLPQADESVPYRLGGYRYFSRTIEGKQYPVHCRQRDAPGAPDEVLLDLNELAADGQYLDLSVLAVSDDGRLLAYSLDTDGSRTYTLRIRDLASGELLPDRLERVTSAAWAADNRTLFYTVEGPDRLSYRLYRHVLGEPADDLLYEEADEGFVVVVQRTRSREYVLLMTGGLRASEAWYLPAAAPESPLRVVRPREPGHLYFVEHRGDRFYIRTNDVHPNYRIVTAPVEDPSRERWTELVAPSETQVLESLDVFERFYAVLLRDEGLPRLEVRRFETDAPHRIAVPEALAYLTPDANPEFTQRAYRYRYESPVTPPHVCEYDVESGETALLKRTDAPGCDADRYETRRLFAAAPDGERIPVSLVARRDALAAGPLPTLLGGYGAYGLSADPGFQAEWLGLLDRGMAIAVAHVRGGGELGERWHAAGRHGRKMNSFTDFIAAAEHLLEAGIAAPGRLAAHGGSAGGLLVGAAINLRPDLFAAAVMESPFLVVLDSLLDPSLPLTAIDYEEFGNAADPAERAWIEEYCPYANLRPQRYPALLVKASLNDPLVEYWHALRYVARLRRLKADDRPLLLTVAAEAGHAGASGRYDRSREEAFVYAFMLWQLGVGG